MASEEIRVEFHSAVTWVDTLNHVTEVFAKLADAIQLTARKAARIVNAVKRHQSLHAHRARQNQRRIAAKAGRRESSGASWHRGAG